MPSTLYTAADRFDSSGDHVYAPADTFAIATSLILSQRRGKPDDLGNFDARGLYTAVDRFDSGGDRVYAPTDAFAVTTSESHPAPLGKFARVKHVLCSVGRRLRHMFPN
ncbi:hypothetical protein B0H15DRAFT_958392 [Mycena belliarum]|uniref:Uncharacterized protein n=1 Tax=Mycena belliarum TaxID=1033014 RepID=A0AAD6XDH3_9AGAR|nr:hypothetical protein B0H15DRAFT_958392 [Mycena belliae]